jgi:hypothetical protein
MTKNLALSGVRSLENVCKLGDERIESRSRRPGEMQMIGRILSFAAGVALAFVAYGFLVPL